MIAPKEALRWMVETALKKETDFGGYHNAPTTLALPFALLRSSFSMSNITARNAVMTGIVGWWSD